MTGYKPRYYAVYGSNAVAVFNSWGQVEYCQKYFKAFRTKRFDTFQEAELYALEMCYDYFPRGRVMPESLICNDIVFFKNCLKPLITLL